MDQAREAVIALQYEETLSALEDLQQDSPMDTKVWREMLVKYPTLFTEHIASDIKHHPLLYKLYDPEGFKATLEAMNAPEVREFILTRYKELGYTQGGADDNVMATLNYNPQKKRKFLVDINRPWQVAALHQAGFDFDTPAVREDILECHAGGLSVTSAIRQNPVDGAQVQTLHGQSVEEIIGLIQALKAAGCDINQPAILHTTEVQGNKIRHDAWSLPKYLKDASVVFNHDVPRETESASTATKKFYWQLAVLGVDLRPVMERGLLGIDNDDGSENQFSTETILVRDAKFLQEIGHHAVTVSRDYDVNKQKVIREYRVRCNKENDPNDKAVLAILDEQFVEIDPQHLNVMCATGTLPHYLHTLAAQGNKEKIHTIQARIGDYWRGEYAHTLQAAEAVCTRNAAQRGDDTAFSSWVAGR